MLKFNCVSKTVFAILLITYPINTASRCLVIRCHSSGNSAACRAVSLRLWHFSVFRDVQWRAGTTLTIQSAMIAHTPCFSAQCEKRRFLLLRSGQVPMWRPFRCQGPHIGHALVAVPTRIPHSRSRHRALAKGGWASCVSTLSHARCPLTVHRSFSPRQARLR